MIPIVFVGVAIARVQIVAAVAALVGAMIARECGGQEKSHFWKREEEDSYEQLGRRVCNIKHKSVRNNMDWLRISSW